MAFPNALATPHVGGNTAEVAAHLGEMAVQALSALLAGQPPAHLLNQAVLPAFSWTGPRHTDEYLLQKLAHGPGPGTTDLDLEAQTRKPTAVSIKTDPPRSFERKKL